MLLFQHVIETSTIEIMSVYVWGNDRHTQFFKVLWLFLLSIIISILNIKLINKIYLGYFFNY